MMMMTLSDAASVGDDIEEETKATSFPYIPSSLFQWKCDGKNKDGKIKHRKVKCLIDGCGKSISVSLTSRGNVKRHIKVVKHFLHTKLKTLSL